MKSFLLVDFKWLDPGAAEALREKQENIGASCRAETRSDESSNDSEADVSDFE